MKHKKKKNSNSGVVQKATFFGYLYRNLVLIIFTVILTTLCGLGYGILTVEPQYTKTSTVMLVTGIETSTGPSSGSNNVTLSQIHLPNVVKMLSSEEFLEGANSEYTKLHEGTIERGNISVKLGKKDSLIFSISYTDVSYEIAEDKLDAVIDNAQLKLKEYIKADNVNLKETCNVRDQYDSYDYAKPVLMGMLIGLVAIIGILTLVYFLDNTAKDREEVEAITGVNVLAYIERVDELGFGEQLIRK